MVATTGQGASGGAVYCTCSKSTGRRRSSAESVRGMRTSGVCGSVRRTETFGQRSPNRAAASGFVT